jgi:ATPase subunit of ABC transporter with duplicated ATPase domains
MTRSIYVENLGFSLPNKICFQDFSTQISLNAKIGIIGKNGNGKSTLLRILYGKKTNLWQYISGS